MKRWLGLLALLALTAPASALVTDISERRIEIRYSFNGADLILFGAVGSTVLGSDTSGIDIVVVVRGPEAPTKLRRKERVAGIWVNHGSLTLPSAPGYYAVAANRHLADIATPEIFTASGIGFSNLRLAYAGGPGKAEAAPEFLKALKRLRAEDGLLREELDVVKIIGEGLFRTNVRLPANAPVGQYQVDAFVFQEGRLQARNRIDMTVDKEGFERAVYSFAHEWPFFYGLTAVVIALLAGWVAALVGRR
ncbi:TIGR02186 family protein [Pseudokordiimonas caeni]|uniref:TIGR02186 family protein n=1 Tax=Pseudokordiimonas caeni TaxID=2997908 RepID=UPI002810B184|nr:TIGR02186 family protein [Pseudokordiimonas caeni]